MPDETVEKQPDTNNGDGAGGDGQQGQTVPWQRFEESETKRHALETQVAELTGKVEALSSQSAAPKKPEAREFSRAELRDAVERGKCTQAEADAIWDDQQARKQADALAQTKAEVVTEITERSRIGGQIDRYRDMLPDLNDRSSDAFRKVAAEYEYMTSELSMPKGEKTELAALRAVYGPVDALAAKAKPKDNRPGINNESAGRGGAGNDNDTGDGAPRDLPPKMKAHYASLIARRMYSGWDDPNLKDELKYVRGQRQAA